MGNPITWKNVGSTVSGNAAANAMAGGVKTLQGAFNPLRQVAADREKTARLQEKDAASTLNQRVADGYQSIGSLAEYNKLRDAGAFSDKLAREKLGKQFDATAAKGARESRLSELNRLASNDARGIGNIAGDAANSQLAGAEAFQNKLRELGASEEYISAQGANYMKTDSLNAAQYKEVTAKNTMNLMSGRTFGSNAEVSAYVAKQKSIHGDSFDIETATKIAKQQMSGAEQDLVKSEDAAIKARKESIDQFVGAAASSIINGATLDQIKEQAASLPENQRIEAVQLATQAETAINSMTQAEKAELTWSQKVADNVSNDLKIQQQSDIGVINAEIASLDIAPDPAQAGAITKMNASMGVTNEVASRYEDGWTAGSINALFAGVGKMTGTKVGEVVKKKMGRLLLDGSFTRNEASGIIFTAEQYARENGAFGTKQFDNKMFEAMVDKMSVDLLKSKELKGKKAKLIEEQAKQTSALNNQRADWEKENTQRLLGNKSTAQKEFSFAIRPSNTVVGNAKDAENKLTQSVSKAPEVLTTKTHYETFADETAKKYDVDSSLVKAVISAESNWKTDAASDKGAKGLMQVMDATAKDLGITDPFDPKQSIEGGTKYLAQLSKRYNGDIDKTLAAYNWGMGNVDRKGLKNIPKETQDYIKKVKSNMTAIYKVTGGKAAIQAAASMNSGTKESNAPKLRTGPPAHKSEVHQMEQKLIKNMGLNIDPDSTKAKAKEKKVRSIVKAWKSGVLADEKILRDRELAALKKLYKAVGADKVIEFLNSPYKKK